MKSRQRPWLALLVITPLLGSACAGHRPQSDTGAPPVGASPDTSDSSVDITYVLGHAHRRFAAHAKDTTYMAQSFFDHQILKENVIDPKHYADFLNKASQFISTPHRVPADQTAVALAEEEACRAPFTVTVRVGSETKSTRGCRVTDDGALSHLVRDGEFLLFSRK
jgi:hypothetical protein